LKYFSHEFHGFTQNYADPTCWIGIILLAFTIWFWQINSKFRAFRDGPAKTFFTTKDTKYTKWRNGAIEGLLEKLKFLRS